MCMCKSSFQLHVSKEGEGMREAKKAKMTAVESIISEVRHFNLPEDSFTLARILVVLSATINDKRTSKK